MSIYDDIKATSNVAELQALYQDQYLSIAQLKDIIKEDEIVRSELTDKIATNLAMLNGYGDLKELRQAFYLKLGKFHKEELNP